MLKYRLIFGPLMIAAMLLVFYLDERLLELDLDGPTAHALHLRALFPRRDHLPAGLLLLALFLVLIPFAARELGVIFRAKGFSSDSLVYTAAGIAGVLIVYAMPASTPSQRAIAIVATLTILVFLVALVKHAWGGQTQGAVAAGGIALFCLIYLGFFPGFYVLIRRWHSAWVVLAIILVTKSSDIGAYTVGRLIGRHKLIPWLSPGKTIEGAIGGVLFATGAAVLLAWILNTTGHAGELRLQARGLSHFIHYDYPLGGAALAGLAMGVVGQFGDLIASLFKRDAGIKDSGSSIPGFGGILDVIDSPLVVAPLAYWLLAAADRYGGNV